MIDGIERRLNREWRGAITRLIRGVSRAPAGDGLAAARRAAHPLVGEESAALTQARLVDRTVSRLAEFLSADVVAPALWFVLFGLPGLCAYAAIGVMGEKLRGGGGRKFESSGSMA